MTLGDFLVTVVAALFVATGLISGGLILWNKVLKSKNKKWMVIRCWAGQASTMKPVFVSAHRTKKGAYRRAYSLTSGMSHAGFWYDVDECSPEMERSKLKERAPDGKG